MPLAVAVLAIARKKIEQLLQSTGSAILVREPRKPVTPFPAAHRAVQTDYDIRVGRERLRHDENKSRT